MSLHSASGDAPSEALNPSLSGTLVADSGDSSIIDTPRSLVVKNDSEVVNGRDASLHDLSSSLPPQPAAPGRIFSKESTPEEKYNPLDPTRPIFNITSSSHAAQSLNMTFNYPSGHQGSFKLKMDLGSLLGLAAPGGPSSSPSVRPPYQQYASAMTSTRRQIPNSGRIIIQSPSKGFHILPPELRNRVYRMLFVKKQPVLLHAGRDLSRSSQFLSYQRQVHQEGVGILYGLNRFIFTRSVYHVGRWFDPVVSATGYSHVEECLHTIGRHNTSLLKHVTFVFTDVSKNAKPDISIDERRFVNDKTLHRCLRWLGKYSKLNTLTVDFQGTRMVMRSDIYFLNALTTIVAKEVDIKGSLDPKIENEVEDYMTYPGKSEPLMRAWNKPW